MSAIAIRNLSKSYPGAFELRALLRRPPRKQPVQALSDVSFDVNEGEIFGLIGPNGAGKTTLTKIIATLVQPTTGAVTVKGFDSVKESAALRKMIGLAAAEERSFYWRLTVEQNLMFFARLYSIPKRKAQTRIAELLAQLDLEHSRAKRFGELSTGNKQRMAIARALLNTPPILLLDEPTRSLDPLAAARMRSLIGSLAAGDPPVTILLTSHNLNEIEELCQRIAIISHAGSHSYASQSPRAHPTRA
jgi:ABC-2 type transport system ATP-binding protein